MVRKYCQDCRFFAVAATGKEYGACRCPQASPASAERYIAPEFERAPYASVTRSSGGCGDAGHWFEPRAEPASKPVSEPVMS
jgi:hypothetical protein